MVLCVCVRWCLECVSIRDSVVWCLEDGRASFGRENTNKGGCVDEDTREGRGVAVVMVIVVVAMGLWLEEMKASLHDGVLYVVVV